MSDQESIIRHLLPRGKAWRQTLGTNLRKFLQALADSVLADVRAFIDGVYNDIWPASTRQLDEWDDQWGLPPTFLTEGQRRERLAGAWSATGGQSPAYLEGVLRAAGFDVYVHEWWVPTARPGGGSVNGDSVPTARNPFTYLNNGTTAVYPMSDGATEAMDGAAIAMDGRVNTLAGYALANRVWADHTATAKKVYTIPADTTKYPYFLYIGGETFPDLAPVPNARRDEFETLCLKHRPLHLWLGMLIQYS